MLNEVLPAVANTYCSSSGGQQHAAGVGLSEPNFLRVDCLGCDRSSGSSGFLLNVLLKLKQSAADQQLSAAASTPEPSNRSVGAMAVAIQDFMRRLPRDRLNFLLVDAADTPSVVLKVIGQFLASDNKMFVKQALWVFGNALTNN